MKRLLRIALFASVAWVHWEGPYIGSVLAAEKSGAAFLKMDVGARAAGMGGAHTAIADDASAAYWNPAGLAGASRELFGAHAGSPADAAGLDHDFLAYAQPGLFGGTLGLSVTSLRSGAIEGRGADRRSAGSFSAADTALGLSFGKSAGAAKVGLGVKAVSQRLGSRSATGFAVDAGLQRPLRRSLSFGAAVQNVGPRLAYEGSSPFNLPLTVRAGLGYSPSGAVTMAFDAKFLPREGRFDTAYGVEYRPFSVMALRAGYRLGGAKIADMTGDDAFAGFQGGFGLNLGASWRLDYAVIPLGDAGTVQRLSFSAKL